MSWVCCATHTSHESVLLGCLVQNYQLAARLKTLLLHADTPVLRSCTRTLDQPAPLQTYSAWASFLQAHDG
eukprot:4102574-Amphidinium_carterae.1